jgi:hypothetical protein
MVRADFQPQVTCLSKINSSHSVYPGFRCHVSGVSRLVQRFWVQGSRVLAYSCSPLFLESHLTRVCIYLTSEPLNVETLNFEGGLASASAARPSTVSSWDFSGF